MNTDSSETLVPWERLWKRLDTSSKDEHSGGGFLQHGKNIFDFSLTDDLRSLDELLDFRCLVLCGEPGMGKSSALQLHRARIEDKARSVGGLCWTSFREALGPSALLDDLKSSTAWQEWQDGKEFTLVIDGFDEGLALAPQFLTVLEARIRTQPIERLRLILACRDAEWPLQEGKLIMRLWGDVPVGRFQLQRLRASDAKQAARHLGLIDTDVDSFMMTVQEKALEDFAARPMTLFMLLNEFKENRQLSGTRPAIFRRGCLRLCREDRRRAAVIRPSTKFEFVAEDLFPAVKRVAAWLLLCRYNAVSTSGDDVGASHHLDYLNLVAAATDERERAKVRKALETALFCGVGHQARAFSHQSYAEFLAAEHLSNFPLVQVLDLLCIHEGGSRFVVPQLAEVAAWLALLHPEFLDWLVKHEPEILLRNDASSLDSSQRRKFVGALLERMASEEAFDDWELKRFYRSFCHAGLAGQLRPYLVDKTASRVVRRAAIHLADFGKLDQVFDELLAIAKDSTQEPHLREQAMQAVGQLVPQERLVELEPFARKEVGNDWQDELRGIALEALVPRHWSVSRALAAILLPHNNDYSGSLETVCGTHIPKCVTISDLPALLLSLRQIKHPFHKKLVCDLAFRTLELSTQELGSRNVSDAFMAFLRDKLRTEELDEFPEQSWNETVLSSAKVRYQLADFFANNSDVTAEELMRLHRLGLIKVTLDDCPWVLVQLEGASTERRPLWAILARIIWTYVWESNHRDEFFEACERIPELAAQVKWPCAVILGSQEDNTMREEAERHRRTLERAKSRPPKPTAEQCFAAALEAARYDWRAWPNLASELQRGEDSRTIVADPTKKPRWQAFGPAQHEVILGCARDFLLNQLPPEHAPGNDQEVPLEIFWALWLLRERIAVDETLRAAVSFKWFDYLFAQPFYGTHEEQQLAGLGCSLAPDRAAHCLRQRLEQAAKPNSSLTTVLLGFELSWNLAFTSVLLGFLKDCAITGVHLRNVFEFLARHDAPATLSWLAKQLKAKRRIDSPTVLALSLALFPKDLWPKAMAHLSMNRALAAGTFQVVAQIHVSSPHQPLDRLDENKVGELFRQLELVCPTPEKIDLGLDERSSEGRIEILRRWAMERLQEMGTAAACDELLRLANDFPAKRTFLRRYLRDARLVLLRRNWRGVPGEVLSSIEAKRESRWVCSNDDLMELVIDSIGRFQTRLTHSDCSLVRRLWNEQPKRIPKSEDALTHELVQWLKDDLGPKNGVALGCNVEPTVVHELDIEISATRGGDKPSPERFLVTIEVKRHYNAEVATSLEKQLVSEYLLKLGRTHGIYIVAWYECGDWNPDHNPLRAKTWKKAASTVENLVNSSRKRHPELEIRGLCLNCQFPQAFRKQPSVKKRRS